MSKRDNDHASPGPEPSPTARWTASLTDEQVTKQQAFYNTRVKHPKMTKLMDQLMPLLFPYSESNIIVVLGATGAGKSTVTRVLLKHLFEDYAKVVENDKSIIPYVAVEAYANGDARHTFKPVFKDIATQLGDPEKDGKVHFEVSNGRLKAKPQAGETVGSLRRSIEAGFRLRGTKVCVVDEAAHLGRLDAKSAVMDTLKSISNTSGVKWVLVGSFDLFDLVCDHGQIARRTTIVSLERYLKERAEDRAAFKELLGKLQHKWPCEEVPNFVAICDELLEVSLGCVGLLKSFLLEASALQLRNGGKWEASFLPRAVKSVKLLNVIRKEIDRGEAKVRDALNGDSSWDDDTLRSLMLRVQPGGHNAAVA